MIKTSQVSRLRAMQAYFALQNQELADLLGVPMTTVIKWTRGERSPSGAAVRLLDLLDLLHQHAPELHSFLVRCAREGRRPL